MKNFRTYLASRLKRLEKRHLLRRPLPVERCSSVHLKRDGKKLISFSCNDYLGLSQHPQIKRAAIYAVETSGAGAAASRLVTGDYPLLTALEKKLAAFKGLEDCVVFGSGYLANLGVLSALASSPDLIVMDALSHACAHDGARLSGAKTILFDHNDCGHLEQILKTERPHARHCFLVTETVFSMDGDRAPLPEIAALAHMYDACLLTDDAHGFGVLGEGRGGVHAFDPRPDIPLQMGTLSKAAGASGGYVCASRTICQTLRTRARSFIYTTGLPPSSAGAALKALHLIKNVPAHTRKPLEKARFFTDLMELPQAESPIIPLVLGEEKRALMAQARLEEEGFLVMAIRPPTVAKGTARLRLTFSADHDEQDIKRLAHTLKKVVAEGFS